MIATISLAAAATGLILVSVSVDSVVGVTVAGSPLMLTMQSR